MTHIRCAAFQSELVFTNKNIRVTPTTLMRDVIKRAEVQSRKYDNGRRRTPSPYKSCVMCAMPISFREFAADKDELTYFVIRRGDVSYNTAISVCPDCFSIFFLNTPFKEMCLSGRVRLASDFDRRKRTTKHIPIGDVKLSCVLCDQAPPDDDGGRGCYNKFLIHKFDDQLVLRHDDSHVRPSYEYDNDLREYREVPAPCDKSIAEATWAYLKDED